MTSTGRRAFPGGVDASDHAWKPRPIRRMTIQVPFRHRPRARWTAKLWLYALALVLFFGGWLAWKNDLNGTWCFRRGSALYWLQGHAVWHVLTMGALACIYWFFRSEKISYS